MDDRMQPAELRVVREYLGLTTNALSNLLNVREDTIHQWEKGKAPIPYRVPDEIAVLEESTAVAVGEIVTALQDAADAVIPVPRSDAELHAAWPNMQHLTARWYRHVVARAAHEMPGVEIVYMS